MFRIGEFSQIARVSGRLLRYYDSIGLLRPVRIDPQTGYRYYSANQLPQLNRILALKELGLSLEQIGRMLDEKISADEIRGMLMLRKAELERSLAEEATRLRHIQSRLQQIDEQGAIADYDVVIKSARPQPFLALRATFPDIAEVVATLRDVARTVTARVPAAAREHLVVVAHSDFDDQDLDLEIGFGLTRAVPNAASCLPDRREMTTRELPAAETLATLVRSGPLYQSHLAFGALGVWMEANGYRVTGPCREVFLEPPAQSADADMRDGNPVPGGESRLTYRGCMPEPPAWLRTDRESPLSRDGGALRPTRQEKTMLKIYGVPFSVHTRKVIVTALEKKLPYQNEPVIPFNPPPGWTDLSPTGKIPAFTDGDVTLCDSSVICAYLERAHPNPPLYPADTRDYVQALWFEEYADGTIFREVIHGLFFNKVIRPKILNSRATRRRSTRSCRRPYRQCSAIWRSRSPGSISPATAFTIADIAVVSNLINFHYLGYAIDAPSQARPLFRADDTRRRRLRLRSRPNRASSPEWASIAQLRCRPLEPASRLLLADRAGDERLVGALGVGWHAPLQPGRRRALARTADIERVAACEAFRLAQRHARGSRNRVRHSARSTHRSQPDDHVGERQARDRAGRVGDALGKIARRAGRAAERFARAFDAGAHIGDRLVDEAPDGADHLGRRREAWRRAGVSLWRCLGGYGFLRDRRGGGQLQQYQAERHASRGESRGPDACSRP